MPQKPKRTTFHKRLSHMVATLRDDIITGKLASGDYLPSETALADEFTLSKNSVRKGLELLVSEGLIEKIPRVGTRIRDLSLENTVMLRLGYYPSLIEDSDLYQLIAMFHERHHHIRVQMIPLSVTSYHETVTHYFEHRMVDLVTVNHENFLQLEEKGAVELLEPVAVNPEIYPFLNNAFTSGGKLRVQPFIFSPVVLCYDKEYFAERNIPEPDSSWTWDTLLSYAHQLINEEKPFGFYFHLPSRNRWPIFLHQSGMRFSRRPNGKFKLQGTPFRESLERCRNLIYSQNNAYSFVSEKDADAERLFLQRKVPMIMTTYFNLNALSEAKFPFELAPLPYIEVPKTLLLSIGLAVHRDSTQKEAAKCFVDFCSSWEAQSFIRKSTYSIPSLKKAAEWQGKEQLYRPSRYHMYREIIPSFSWLSDLRLTTTDFYHLEDELRFYWSRLEDIDETCRRLEEVL